jgi:TonB-linked SusC/RagA family outer membrane protein
MNLSYAWRKSTYIDTGVNSVLMNAVRMPSTVPAYNEDGSLGYPIGNEGDGQNPIGYAQRSKGPVNTNRLLINIFGDYKILPSLAFHSNFGADINYYRYTHFQPTFQNGNSHNDVNSLYESDSNTNSLSWENTLSFNKKFNNHDILVMIGNSIITSDYRYISASKSHFISNDDKMQYFDAGTKEDQVYGNRTDWAQLSYFGRINYNYANKYLAQFNIRRDGSSRFGKNNRWGTFPSIALGWRISEENFMKDVKWISNMKLRASYGVLGTQPTAVYGFTTSLDQYKYILGSNQDVVIGYAPSSKSNDDFKWETTDQTNLGLDLGFFKNSLNFTIEYYDKYTKGILQVLPLPSYSGMGGTLTNIGEMKNTGLELTCQYNNHVNDFNYNVGFNFSTLKNTVKKLFNDNSPIYGNYNRTEVGRSVGEFYGFVFDGIFQNQAEIDAYKAQPDAVPGDARFKDLDGNNVINEDDMDFLGSPLPKVTYGINLGFDYKGFDFVLFMQGVGGNKIYYSGKRYLIDGGNNFNKSTDILNRWQKEGDMTNIPRVSVKNSNDNFRRSSLFIENGSYLRINNIQLGYTLKKQWIKPIGLEKVRFYISVNNLATFTKYSGYDPAVDISDVFSPGDDQITYPVSRTFLAGFSLTF